MEAEKKKPHLLKGYCKVARQRDLKERPRHNKTFFFQTFKVEDNLFQLQGHASLFVQLVKGHFPKCQASIGHSQSRKLRSHRGPLIRCSERKRCQATGSYRKQAVRTLAPLIKEYIKVGIFLMLLSLSL